VFDAVVRLFELVARWVEALLGRRRELRAARNRVVSRLKGMRSAEGKAWDDEKWLLGSELDRLNEAIAQKKAGPEWVEAEERTRERVLIAGDPSAIDQCLGDLERLS
jgi:hypothetical protein